MADQSRKPNRKRQHKNEQKPAAKRQRRYGCEKPDNAKHLLAMPEQPIYYLDEFFPLEILIQIVQEFSLNELFELGKTSPAFGPAVEEIYGKKYSDTVVHLSPPTHHPHPFVEMSYNGIHVVGLEMCIWYLKLFGKKIMEIEADCKGLNAMEIRRFNQLLAENCADTLENIKYNAMVTDPIIHPIVKSRPLNKVNRVSFQRSHLHGYLQSISSFFPNVRCLSLENTTASNITVNFPNLKEFTINEDYSAKESLSRIQSILNSNPDVSRLIIIIYDAKHMALSTILKAIPKSASLSELMVKTRPGPAALPLATIKKIIREHGQLTKLDLPIHRFRVNDVIYLLTHSNLKELKYSPDRSSGILKETLPLLSGRGTWIDAATGGGIHLRLTN